MDLELNQKTAIVTGASLGIGRAIARQLSLEGANVVVAARSEERLRAAAATIADETGARVEPVVADTTDPAQIGALVATTVQLFGGVDILVNNASRAGGSASPPNASAVPPEGVAADFDEKVLGYLRCIQAVVPIMRAQGFGRIINVAGQAARTTGAVSSSIRQAAISALSKNLADEVGRDGINITAIHPGATRTESLAEKLAASGSNDLLRHLEGMSTLGRLIEPEEVGWLVAFLASPRSVSVNGDTITCGGGLTGTIYY
jgi:NAD(P)-dependent dehydrogenase (short-subunit alcohol dehydrogenase family)